VPNHACLKRLHESCSYKHIHSLIFKKVMSFIEQTFRRAGSETVVRTALVYYCIHSGLYTRTVQYTVYNGAGVQGCCRAGLATKQGRRQPPQGSPQALASEKERTRSEVDPHWQFPLVLQVPPL
jgi:hypothetical protein